MGKEEVFLDHEYEPAEKCLKFNRGSYFQNGLKF